MLKNFFKEFKEFVSKGNVLDMAIGIIIGGAFTTIVSSLVEDIINPILGLFGGMNFDQYKLTLLGDSTIYYGKFITAIIKFLIIAVVVFVMLKFINGATSKISHKKEEIAAPSTKKCPYCMSEIDINATRCPHCTSELEIEPGYDCDCVLGEDAN